MGGPTGARGCATPPGAAANAQSSCPPSPESAVAAVSERTGEDQKVQVGPRLGTTSAAVRHARPCWITGGMTSTKFYPLRTHSPCTLHKASEERWPWTFGREAEAADSRGHSVPLPQSLDCCIRRWALYQISRGSERLPQCLRRRTRRPRVLLLRRPPDCGSPRRRRRHFQPHSQGLHRSKTSTAAPSGSQAHSSPTDPSVHLGPALAIPNPV